MQGAYAIEQEAKLRQPLPSRGQSLHDLGAVRIAILDDQYIVAAADLLVRIWQPLMDALQQSDHSVQPFKSKAYAPRVVLEHADGTTPTSPARLVPTRAAVPRWNPHARRRCLHERI